MVALGVVAFRDGGVAAVGAVTAARMASAALLAPWLATMADRVRRERVLACVGVVRAVTLGAIAVVTVADGPAAATYALAVVATVAMTLYRPAHSALLPALAKSPRELTSANAVRGMLDSLATLGGPLVAALLLAASGPARGVRRVRRRVAAGRAGRHRAPVRRAAPGGGRRRRRPRAAARLRHHRGRSPARPDHGARPGADVHARLPDRVRRRRRDRPPRHGRPGRRRPQRRDRRRRGARLDLRVRHRPAGPARRLVRRRHRAVRRAARPDRRRPRAGGGDRPARAWSGSGTR